MKASRAHPFVKCVKRISGFQREITKCRSDCQQHTQNQFEQGLYHSTRATIANYRITGTSTSMNHEHGTRYIRVIIDRAIHRELDYSVPESLANRIGVGSRVRVPFRDKSALATVVAI